MHCSALRSTSTTVAWQRLGGHPVCVYRRRVCRRQSKASAASLHRQQATLFQLLRCQLSVSSWLSQWHASSRAVHSPLLQQMRSTMWLLGPLMSSSLQRSPQWQENAKQLGQCSAVTMHQFHLLLQKRSEVVYLIMRCICRRLMAHNRLQHPVYRLANAPTARPSGRSGCRAALCMLRFSLVPCAVGLTCVQVTCCLQRNRWSRLAVQQSMSKQGKVCWHHATPLQQCSAAVMLSQVAVLPGLQLCCKERATIQRPGSMQMHRQVKTWHRKV